MSERATDDNAGHGTVSPGTQDPVEEHAEMVRQEATPEMDVQQLLEQMARMHELLSNKEAELVEVKLYKRRR